MGEISVLLVAATGVASLLFLRDRTGIVDSARNRARPEKEGQVWDDGQVDLAASLRAAEGGPPAWLRAPNRGQEWLTGGTTLAPRRRSVIFEIGTRLVFHSMVILSLYLLFAGHNQPGGGFAGGLVAGTAMIVRYLAGGRYELGETLPLHAGYLLGVGLTIATGAALIPILFGGEVLQTAVFELVLPVWGEVKIATALLFDLGVYVLVLGLVLDVLRSLGAEIDRHGEIEGFSDEEADDQDGEAPAPTPDAGVLA
jgi:multicomponent Na+:H+ antiporter subunit A